MPAAGATPFPPAGIPSSSVKAPAIIDLSDIKDELIDLAPGAMKGLRAEQAGVSEVIQELTGSTLEQRNAANIPAHV